MWLESADGKYRVWISPEELAAIRKRHALRWLADALREFSA